MGGIFPSHLTLVELALCRCVEDGVHRKARDARDPVLASSGIRWIYNSFVSGSGRGHRYGSYAGDWTIICGCTGISRWNGTMRLVHCLGTIVSAVSSGKRLLWGVVTKPAYQRSSNKPARVSQHMQLPCPKVSRCHQSLSHRVSIVSYSCKITAPSHLPQCPCEIPTFLPLTLRWTTEPQPHTLPKSQTHCRRPPGTGGW